MHHPIGGWIVTVFIFYIISNLRNIARQLKRNQAATCKFCNLHTTIQRPVRPRGNLIKSLTQKCNYTLRLPWALYCVHLIRTTFFHLLFLRFKSLKRGSSAITQKAAIKKKTSSGWEKSTAHAIPQRGKERFFCVSLFFIPTRNRACRADQLTIFFRGQFDSLKEWELLRRLTLDTSSHWIWIESEKKKCNNNQTKLLFKHITNHNRNLSSLSHSN